METNYLLIGVVVVLAVALIAFLIWRNFKDERKYEQDTTRSELKPEIKPENDETGY